MHRRLITIAVLGGLVFLSTARATVVTWNFGGSAAQVANGTAFNTTLGTITAYAEQTNASGTIVSPYMYYGTPTESGLFRVNNNPNDHGVGMAPYNPVNGSSNSFANQWGLTDENVSGAPANYNNFILLDLGSNIAQGTTLSFLLQAGVSGDSFDLFTQNGAAMPTALGGAGGMTMVNGKPISVDEPGSILGNGSSQPTNPQYTITKSVSGVEWVAVSADCHYMLLDSITGTSPSTVPEPRFYGLLMAGLLGIAGIYARKRRPDQQIA